MATKKHHLYIAKKEDVNLEGLLRDKIEGFDFVIKDKVFLDKTYSHLYKFSELKRANFAVIETDHHSLKGSLYFYPKLDIYSSNGLFKEGIIGVDASQSKDYSIVKINRYSAR